VGFRHGISLLAGWLPITVQAAAAVIVLTAVGWRTRQWRLVWLPLSVGTGTVAAMAARSYMNSQGLASDPAPDRLWIWVAVCTGAIAVAVLGWRAASRWRRALSMLAIPLTLTAVLLTLNQWVGYYPTVQAAWNALTAGPLPDEVDAPALTGLRNTSPSTGKLVKVDIPDTASGFKHRSEYVYLPPAWFAGATPPALPAIMMIAGEFNTPADWIRSGNIIPVLDGYAASHNGQAPLVVFVDAGGRFNNDTECVNGPRGDAADHLTADVRPYVVDHFGASASAAAWGIVGWSMGGTCAVDLTVMHPELFSNFVDIAGDHGPTAGTKEQTIERLYGGNAEQWAKYDPATVMARHGPYNGVAGWFEEAIKPASSQSNSRSHNSVVRPQSPALPGYGGHDVWNDADAAGAAEDLCRSATAVNISCSVHRVISGHTWQLAANTFTEALPWMTARLAMSGSAGTP
jgi:S-formylglutathione hydrolase FrmB